MAYKCAPIGGHELAILLGVSPNTIAGYRATLNLFVMSAADMWQLTAAEWLQVVLQRNNKPDQYSMFVKSIESLKDSHEQHSGYKVVFGMVKRGDLPAGRDYNIGDSVLLYDSIKGLIAAWYLAPIEFSDNVEYRYIVRASGNDKDDYYGATRYDLLKLSGNSDATPEIEPESPALDPDGSTPIEDRLIHWRKEIGGKERITEMSSRFLEDYASYLESRYREACLALMEVKAAAQSTTGAIEDLANVIKPTIDYPELWVIMRLKGEELHIWISDQNNFILNDTYEYHPIEGVTLKVPPVIRYTGESVERVITGIGERSAKALRRGLSISAPLSQSIMDNIGLAQPLVESGTLKRHRSYQE